MQKDVIYIDVEDDITAIIGKVKAAKEKIVALVPPKRIGVLQSAVNLRLLMRVADTNNKRLVLITNNQALIGLAASAKMPIARNLQSKPEMAEIPALEVDNGDDVIDGGQLPIGEHAKTASAPTSQKVGMAGAMAAVLKDDPPTYATPPANGETPAKAKVKGKVPDFNKFRKRTFFIIGAAILLIGFLIWAIFFAPRATIVIAAKTTSASINSNVALGMDIATSTQAGTIKSLMKEVKKDSTVEFDATGKKDVGEKATGTVRFSTDSIAVARNNPTIPAGTVLTASNGKTYITNSSVTLSLSSSSDSTGVTATGSGTSFNGVSGSVNGAPSGVNASLTGATSGGTDKEITVVSAEDVQKATAQLGQQNTDQVKKELQGQFGNDVIVIDNSLTSTKSDPASTPAVGGEVSSGKAKLTSAVTYQMSGIAKSELKDFLTKSIETQIQSTPNQRIYSDGVSTAKFANFVSNQDGVRVTLTATGQVGPKINDEEIKNQAKGKRYGEIQQSIEAIQGVNDVDVKYWPFWVRDVPNDVNRITVEFKLDESN